MALLLFRLAALCVAQAAIARAVVYGPFNTSWQYPTFADQSVDGGTAGCSWDAPLSDMLTNDGNGVQTVLSLEPPRISWSIRTGVYDFSSMPDTASVTGLNYRIETCQNGGWRVDLWRLGTAFGVTSPTWAEKDTDVPDDCGSRTALTYGDGSTTDNLGLPLFTAAQYKNAFRLAVQFRGVGTGGGAGPFVFVYWSQLKIFWTLTTSITSTSPTSLDAATGGTLFVTGGDFELIPDHDIKCRFDGSQIVAGTRQSSTVVRCDAPAIPSLTCTRNVPVEISLDGVTYTNSVAVEYTGSLGGCTPSTGSGTTGNSPPVTTGGSAQPSSTTGVVGSGGPATTGIGGSGVSATTTAVGGGSGVSATTGVAVSATSSSMTQQTSSVTSTSSTGTSAGGGTQPPPITTAGANAADSTPADEEDGGAGLIVGIIVAVCVVLCVVAIVAAVVVLRKKGDSEEGSGRSEDGSQHAELDEKPGPALPAETSSSSDEDGGVEVYANVGDMDVDDSDSEPGNPADVTSPEVVYASLDQFRPSETPGGGVDSPGNIVYAELGEFKDITV